MKMHHQFDLNFSIIRPMGRELLTIPPYLVEELITKLTKRGYTVLKSSAYHMGIPQSITVIKEFTGPFVTKFSAKVQHDFNAVARALGIERLFE
ncbi:hypothetical protein HYX03_03825 [Candidatus Woesearchaeota archaeon]|nr:hypothetical protein [Candidatus Woesearchaeota archaeon]